MSDKQVTTSFSAIEMEIENEQTGAITSYHVPTSMNVDFVNKTVAVNLSSYVSERTYKAGKMSVGYIYKILPMEELKPIDVDILEKIINQDGSELNGGKLV